MAEGLIINSWDTQNMAIMPALEIQYRGTFYSRIYKGFSIVHHKLISQEEVCQQEIVPQLNCRKQLMQITKNTWG